MKEGDIIFTLTDQKAASCYAHADAGERAKALVSVLEDIAYMSFTQEQLTKNLTLLRQAAREADEMRCFTRCLEAAKQNIAPADMNGLEWRFSYCLSDFTETEEPYREVFGQPTAFLKQRALERISIEAARCGFRGFKKMYQAYEKGIRQVNERSLTLMNPSDFPHQPIELECGEWHCDSSGVSKIMKGREESACLHPIMPVERLVNIDTGEEKLRVGFYKNGIWREFIAGKLDLFDASKVIKFSALGVAVTSKSAKLLSEYLCDIETLNPDIIPESGSVGRLGYIGDGSRFSPYVDDLVFDGDANYRDLYAAVTSCGDYDAWLSEAKKCRSDSLTAHIMLAASFASPLLCKIGCLPFFVHLWGVESGTGKTVALMLAASVWGDPETGRYIQTFNSTQVSSERTAAFLNNIPLCIDELQLSRDSHGHSRFDVYQLAQGAGRGRGNKAGGIDTVPTWSLCILTTGESPIVQETAGAGAVNRVIDIECSASGNVIRDGFTTSSVIRQNYGFAGRKFVEALTDEVTEQARIRYNELFRTLSAGDSTEKQAMAAAMIVLADELADRFIFKTGRTLTTEDISGFLKARSEVSAGQRAYNFLCDWVAVNASRFQASDNNGEFWGKVDTLQNKAYIISAVFRKALTENGFNERAVTSWLRSNNLIEPDKDGKSTKYTSVSGRYARYVVMQLADNNNPNAAADDEYTELL